MWFSEAIQLSVNVSLIYVIYRRPLVINVTANSLLSIACLALQRQSRIICFYYAEVKIKLAVFLRSVTGNRWYLLSIIRRMLLRSHYVIYDPDGRCSDFGTHPVSVCFPYYRFPTKPINSLRLRAVHRKKDTIYRETWYRPWPIVPNMWPTLILDDTAVIEGHLCVYYFVACVTMTSLP